MLACRFEQVRQAGEDAALEGGERMASYSDVAYPPCAISNASSHGTAPPDSRLGSSSSFVSSALPAKVGMLQEARQAVLNVTQAEALASAAAAAAAVAIRAKEKVSSRGTSCPHSMHMLFPAPPPFIQQDLCPVAT